MNTGTERQIALDRQREDLLQPYLTKILELLLEKELRSSLPDAEVRKIARACTISVLTQLDTKRVGFVFAFLREAGLTDESNPIVDLNQADLRGVVWKGADLSYANLSGARLAKANLSRTSLVRANLSKAHLGYTDLSFDDLDSADLTETILIRTNFRGAFLGLATFRKADIKGVNLSRAKIGIADFRDAEIDKSMKQLTNAVVGAYRKTGIASGLRK